MRAIKLTKPEQVDCVGLKRPVLSPGQALIRIKTAGVCGSDIGAFRETNKLISYPGIIRHESIGIVGKIPADNPKGLRVGDKVIVDPYLYYGACYPYSIGRTNCYTSLKVLGVHVDRGVAEYYCHLADMLVRIPEDVDWTGTAMVEPLTIFLHETHRGGLKIGKYCAIIGAGPIRPLAGMITQACGAHTILLDLVQECLGFAKELGVEYVINSREEDPVERVSRTTGGTMTQQVMKYSGANVAMLQILDLVNHAGKITLTGWPPKGTPTPTDVITRKEIDIHDVRISAGEFEEAIELIYTKRVNMTKILTKTIGLEEAPETIRDIEKSPGNYMKVVVKMD